MRINNNIAAINTHRQYGINNTNVSKSTEKLSSGYRINRAGDDAAGLAISEKMRAQIRGLTMASKNSQDAISLVQTAEGALQESHNILQRMRELAVQSASDTNETTIDRGALEQEFQQLIKELDDTANKTRFNDQNLIDGTFQSAYTTLSSAAGFATRSNTAYSAKLAAGTYEHTASYTQSTQVITGGLAPTVANGTLGAASVLTTFEMTGLGTLTGSFALADKATLTAAEQVDTEANANQFKLTFELESAGGVKDSFDVYAEYDSATGTFTISGDALGTTLSLVAEAGSTTDEVLAALQDKVNSITTVATGTAAFSSASTVDVTYTAGTIDNATTEFNGTYTISAKSAGSLLGDDIEITLTGPNGDVSIQKLNLASLIGATTTESIDLGQFGTIALASTNGTLSDLLGSLNGKTITVSGGSAPYVSGNPASAKVTDSNGNNIEIKAGMTSYTGTDGITITFAKELTAADFKSQATFETAIGGAMTATVRIAEHTGKSLTIQTGANQGDDLAINIDKMDAWNLGVDLSSVKDLESAQNAITEVNNAINQVSTQRAALGALQNRLDHKIANLDTSAENLTSAESRIRDIDMAKEMTNFTKNNILFQASTAMLAQANAMPQGVLQLLG